MKTGVAVMALLLTAFSGRSWAWNIPGHMLSAMIAFQILEKEQPATIEKVKAALDPHPWHSTRWQNSLAAFQAPTQT